MSENRKIDPAISRAIEAYADVVARRHLQLARVADHGYDADKHREASEHLDDLLAGWRPGLVLRYELLCESDRLTRMHLGGPSDGTTTPEAARLIARALEDCAPTPETSDG